MTGSAPVVTLEMTRIEAGHLADLVGQFADLLRESGSRDGRAPADPAVARLVPDAYRDDVDAADEFREITEAGLLRRRAEDAEIVLHTIGSDTTMDTASDDALVALVVSIDVDEANAWMRTLASLRLVLASRLGIRTEDDHDPDDPRFGVYDWLGYRLEGLIQAIDA